MIQNSIDIAVEDARWAEAVPDLDAFVERAVAAALAVMPDSQAGPMEISILLADDATVQALNKTWRGKDKPTNVLSFPAAEQPLPPGAPEPLGDVVLAYDTLLRESAEQSKPLSHHLAHLLVHGTLHLLGQDHETGESQADAMEALEVAALATLGIPDPYADLCGD
ncbi:MULTISPECIES: rRNA maturation RNase YbeY [Methylobacterium]|uniref:Endoribonuclease YbeY n=1 Tax=Methylobacterium thuringiense TaxID=1003091 RepID=A0ABQ4TSB5_9HYPH|nr:MULTISPECIES: rRNA maturation RNase YbeY [Methylobacterium]TXN23131.1 rRNA maturation RNase YbeY [Methylobacterium sp. WL9]GJE57558.1 Endoribonuclease YbeY [Methylobacterium thuringiense]